jgi:hypothetical protein
MKLVAYGLLLTVALLMAACGGGSSGGRPGNPNGTDSAWLIPAIEVWDGGPGQDGIPSIDHPQFTRASDTTYLAASDRVVGVFVNGQYHAYPHRILDSHEVLNDAVDTDAFVLSYCPLTGSALAWDVVDDATDTEFGVSGLIYNSNLILYDRASGSRWSQMLQQSVWGERSGTRAEQIQIIETSWQTWLSMYPDSLMLTRDTGVTRSYNVYPYGNYRTNSDLLFPVAEPDNRLHPKRRVIGIHSNTASKAYQIDSFGTTTQTINDHFDGNPIVVVGNSDLDFAAIYSRELNDGTILEFSTVPNQLPVVMSDSEGNNWDIFGNAVSGPRTGVQLERTTSFTAMWFAWAAFFENTEIHFN